MSIPRTTVCLLSASVFFMLFAGCGPEIKDVDQAEVIKSDAKADIAIKFAAGTVGTYRHFSETIQDFKFEQPSLKKVKEEQVRIVIDIEFDQKIETVNSDGSALAKITFTGIRTFFTARDGVRFDFDSRRKADKKKSFYSLIGKSYTVTLFPDGGAKAVDTKKAMAAVTGAAEKRVATTLLSDKEIRKRHGIPGLPAGDQSLKGVGESWSKVTAGHQKLIPPKTFKKTYKVSKIEGKGGKQIAVVAMNAVESDKAVEGLEDKSGMSFLGAMFDTKETYTGSMTFDSAGGRVVGYDEKLVAEYIATQENVGAAKEDRPDMLTMALTYSISLKSINNSN